MSLAAYLLIGFNLLSKAGAVAIFAVAPWSAVGGWLLADAVVLYHLLVPGAQGLVRAHRSFAPSRREVWLTIDDGPDPEDTPQILALLAEQGARATFFVIGEAVERYPELVRAIVAGGHEVAHHTHTHPLASFWCATPRKLRDELDRPLVALRALGVEPRWFRSPAGVNNFWLQPALDRRGLEFVGWSVRGLESASREADEVVARVRRGLRPGAIILLHEGPRVPAAVRLHALRGVLAMLRAEGYAAVLPEAAQLRRVLPSAA
jgi:peptidoglycan/xylan/chitin deacetylase (PgdA/CDA1 family)